MEADSSALVALLDLPATWVEGGLSSAGWVLLGDSSTLGGLVLGRFREDPI